MKSSKASFKRAGNKRIKVEKKVSSDSSDQDDDADPEASSDSNQDSGDDIHFDSQRDYWASQGMSWWGSGCDSSWGWAMHAAISDKLKWESLSVSQAF